MARFVNISAKENSPSLVNADKIAAIYESASRDEVVISLKTGENISLEREDAGLAFGDCAQKLAQNGLSLFPVSIAAEQDEDEEAEKRALFINPAAVTFLNVSESHIPENKTEPHVYADIGIEGYGREGFELPVSTLEKLVDVVQQERGALARIDKNEVLYFGRQPGYVAYDPRKITSVEENCGFMHVYFALSGYVRFDVRSLEFHAACQAYGNKIRPPSGVDEDASWEKMYAFIGKIEGRLRREFARKVARDVPDLVKLEGAQTILYMRFNDVSRVTMHAGEGPDKKSVVMIFYPKDSPNCTGQSHKRGFYDTPEAAQKEMARLQTLLGEPS